MYIQEEPSERERGIPPDYRGQTYKAPEKVPERVEFSTEESLMPPDEPREAQAADVGEEENEKSTPVGAFGGGVGAAKGQKGGKRGDFFGNLGLSGLFSRVPFLSALAPPPRRCEEERKRSELWDWVLLAVVALSLLNGRDDDVLPLLLLLLLWD